MAANTTLILGLGNEVGRAIARAFHDIGHNVAIADPSEARTERARSDLPESVLVLREETSSPGGLHNIFTEAEASFTPVRNLVLIPPIPEEDAMIGLEDKCFEERVLDPMKGTLETLRTFHERLPGEGDEVDVRARQSRQRGAVTLILSSLAHMSQPDNFTATLSQRCHEAMVKAAALELARETIRVNAVVALRPRARDREGSWHQKRIPMGRVALADEIASAAVFLSSNGAALITGETLVIDGARALLAGNI